MKIDYTKRFRKNFRRASREVKKSVTQRMGVFKDDPFHPILNNHKLQGEYVGCRSINITGDWRAIYRMVDGSIEWVEFVQLGTHSELYG